MDSSTAMDRLGQLEVPDSVPRRVREKIRVMDTGCWIWIAGCSHNKSGRKYPLAWVSGKSVRAHVALWNFVIGEVPKDKPIAQPACGDPLCVAPHHMVWMSWRRRLMRSRKAVAAINHRKTHCPKCGNEYDTVRYSRRCSACESAKKRAERASSNKHRVQYNAWYAANRERVLAVKRAWSARKKAKPEV